MADAEVSPAAAPPTTTTDTPDATIELLRKRGNAAFSRGAYSRAGELYRRALAAAVAARGDRAPGVAKLHSNLAAVCLQLGRPRAALAACASALEADPGFGRAAVRAATCHMRVGAFGAAASALDAADAAAGRPDATDESRARADAAAKRAELAALRSAAEAAVAAADAATSDADAQAALTALTPVLAPAATPYAPDLRATRCRLLLALGLPGEAAAAAAPSCDDDRADGTPAWAAWVSVQAAFFEGRLADVATALEARAAAGDGGAAAGPHPRGLAPPSAAAAASAAAALRAALAARAAGNAAHTEGRHEDADAAYSRGLDADPPPPPAFAAVLLANRGAARRARGARAAALADCLASVALAPSYAKAAVRAAELLSEVGLADDAVARLEDAASAGAPQSDLAPALATARAAAASSRHAPAVDHYALLGLPATGVTDSDVRAAYKRAALAHHPDKAAARVRAADRLTKTGVPLLAASTLTERVHAAADFLFKAVGAARAALADARGRAIVDAALAAKRADAARPAWNDSMQWRRSGYGGGYAW